MTRKPYSPEEPDFTNPENRVDWIRWYRVKTGAGLSEGMDAWMEKHLKIKLKPLSNQSEKQKDLQVASGNIVIAVDTVKMMLRDKGYSESDILGVLEKTFSDEIQKMKREN